jgi:hypothetical protein
MRRGTKDEGRRVEEKAGSMSPIQPVKRQVRKKAGEGRERRQQVKPRKERRRRRRGRKEVEAGGEVDG